MVVEGDTASAADSDEVAKPCRDTDRAGGIMPPEHTMTCEGLAHDPGLGQEARISIRAAGPADAAAIAMIHEAAVRGATVAKHYGEAQIDAWAQPRTASRLREQIGSRRFFMAGIPSRGSRARIRTAPAVPSFPVTVFTQKWFP